MKTIADPRERAAAATDVILGLTAAGAALVLQGLPSSGALRLRIWTAAFCLMAAAAGLGAAVHGLALAEALRRGLWCVLTLALGVAISLFLAAVVHDLFGEAAACGAAGWLAAAGGGVFIASRFSAGVFRFFLLYEAAALAAALAAYGWLWAARGAPGAAWMTAGALVSLAAAALQTRRGLRVRLVWELDHNALFHLVQAAGIALFCRGLARMSAA
jgi:hypothetical protein